MAGDMAMEDIHKNRDLGWLTKQILSRSSSVFFLCASSLCTGAAGKMTDSGQQLSVSSWREMLRAFVVMYKELFYIFGLIFM